MLPTAPSSSGSSSPSPIGIATRELAAAFSRCPDRCPDERGFNDAGHERSTSVHESRSLPYVAAHLDVLVLPRKERSLLAAVVPLPLAGA